jgi:hypothetical protein
MHKLLTFLTALASIVFAVCSPSLAQMGQIPVYTQPAPSSGPTTIFTPNPALATNYSGLGGNSLRTVATITGSGAGRVCVTFLGGTSSLVVAHASIGVWTGSNTDTTATPVELKFSGVSGFTLSANGIIVSDLETLAFTSSNKLVVVLDITSGDFEATTGSAVNSNSGLVGSASYNQATPPETPLAGYNFSVNLIETSP